MKKTQWNTPPHLRDRKGDIEQMRARIAELEIELSNEKQQRTYMREAAEHFQDQVRRTEYIVQRYEELKHIGVVVMDGECKHLQGDALDAYIVERLLNRHNLLADMLAKSIQRSGSIMQIQPTWFSNT